MAGLSKILPRLSIPNTTFLQLSSERYISRSTVIARNKLFTREQDRQRSNVGRIEKIEVRYLGKPKDVTLLMNRSLSTPYNCAQFLSEDHCKSSALALIDGNVPWDMHRPFEKSCTLQLLNFTIAEPHLTNKCFWRTCSFMLGSALQNVFKDDILQLHSFPGPNIKSGSFVHDIVLGDQSWKPSKSELQAISAEMANLSAQDLKIERLDVSGEVALEMFQDSYYKTKQLPSILQQNHDRVILYRMGTHIDISRGPMVASSRCLGKCTISAAHKIAHNGKGNAIYRIQGVALPNVFVLNHISYGLLEERSKKLNLARLPNEMFGEVTAQLG